MKRLDWIAIDWGTTNLRAWAMTASGEVLQEEHFPRGMATLQPSEFETTLLQCIEDWLTDKPLQVIACGMVGSRQGWQEVPYLQAPCTPSTELIRVKNRDRRMEVYILPGIQQAEPADVMRGEETQIAGFLMQSPTFNGVLCLPGTHTKWVEVSNGRVKHFKTAMTGEIFSLLYKKSVLRHSLGQWQDMAFVDAVAQSFQHPESLLSSLFTIRASALLNEETQGIAALSGSLIGTEIASTRQMWQGQPICILGEKVLAEHYHTAFTYLGIKASCSVADNLTLMGLSLAYTHFCQQTTPKHNNLQGTTILCPET